MSYPRLATHLCIDTPFEEARNFAHEPHYKEAEFREEEAGKLLLSSNLTEYFGINLTERCASGNGLNSIRSRLHSIVQPLAGNAVSKSACIANQDDTVV